MTTLSYRSGHWHAEARMQELEAGKMMAVISVSDDNGDAAHGSRHTVVFEGRAGADHGTELEGLLRSLLRRRFGA